MKEKNHISDDDEDRILDILQDVQQGYESARSALDKILDILKR